MGSFRSTLIQLSKDGLVDRADWQQIKDAGQKALKNKGSDEAWMAKQVLAFLDKYSEARHIRYGIPGQQLDFTFTPAYAESDPIPGETMRDKLSHVSQGDNLPETLNDGNRCGAASLLNAWLLLGGSFAEANQKLGLNATELTYGNLHRAQEALFAAANSDGNDSLSSSYSYTFRGDQVLDFELRGEISAGIDKLGLTGELLLNKSVSNLTQRQQVVQNFWQQHPEGVLLTGVFLDANTGDMHSPSPDERQNHFVLVFQEQGKLFYLLDTGASDNGSGNSLHPLTAEQLEGFVYQSSGNVIGLTK